MSNKIKKLYLSIIFSAAFCFIFFLHSQNVQAETYQISSFDDLKAKIEAAPDDGTETILEVSNDILFTETLVIKNGKNITLMSAGNTAYTLTQTSGRHFDIKGSLTLTNIIIDGGKLGGGIFSMNILIILDGTVIKNCISNFGGGVNIYDGSFTMSGGTITENMAYDGGGICILSGNSSITGGEIINNTANGIYDTSLGGGIYVSAASLNISGNTKISGNRSVSDGAGGGIAVLNGTLNISQDTLITDNEAVGSDNVSSYSLGGGIYITSGFINITDNVKISRNRAAGDIAYGGGIFIHNTGVNSIVISDNVVIDGNSAHEGGGIYTTDTTYSDLNIGPQIIFSGNKALYAYAPPENAASLYPNIQFAGVSISSHPLNNYDINHINVDILTFHVDYNANGGTGSHTGSDVVPSGTDIVQSLEDTGMDNPDHTFIDWNTAADGSGVSYAPGDDIILNNNIILYAMWTNVSVSAAETTATEQPSVREQAAESAISAPKTGDNGIILWITILYISFIVMIIFYVLSIKKED